MSACVGPGVRPTLCRYESVEVCFAIPNASLVNPFVGELFALCVSAYWSGTPRNAFRLRGSLTFSLLYVWTRDYSIE